MTLYQRNKMKASSQMSGHEAFYALDESMLTFWQPCDDDECPCISVDLEAPYNVCASRIIWRDIGMETMEGIYPGAFQYVVEYAPTPALDTWEMLIDASENNDDLCVDYRETADVLAYGMRLRILGAPKGITPGLVSMTAFGNYVRER